MCNMCGNIEHDDKDCEIKISIKCPVCNSGTYIHHSGIRACVNAFCSWIEEYYYLIKINKSLYLH